MQVTCARFPIAAMPCAPPLFPPPPLPSPLMEGCAISTLSTRSHVVGFSFLRCDLKPTGARSKGSRADFRCPRLSLAASAGNMTRPVEIGPVSLKVGRLSRGWRGCARGGSLHGTRRYSCRPSVRPNKLPAYQQKQWHRARRPTSLLPRPFPEARDRLPPANRVRSFVHDIVMDCESPVAMGGARRELTKTDLGRFECSYQGRPTLARAPGGRGWENRPQPPWAAALRRQGKTGRARWKPCGVRVAPHAPPPPLHPSPSKLRPAAQMGPRASMHAARIRRICVRREGPAVAGAAKGSRADLCQQHARVCRRQPVLPGRNWRGGAATGCHSEQTLGALASAADCIWQSVL
ncbi:uncharacterized protein VTP21DRAFT_3606 [Calcarisporiella thermophila]|uniref:uncharacterized protein n=1 Tax=Calcarisporiella thermophila TaxID=911321 RepID=UPI0037449A13